MTAERWASPPGPELATRLAILILLLSVPGAAAEETSRESAWETVATRNRVSSARDLPQSWDVESRRNVRWVAELGTEAYGGPTVGGGRVFVGTNNERPRDEGVVGDRGVVMAFDIADGSLLWQSTHPKLESGAQNDWPLQGVCSTPAVSADGWLYYVSNRGELVALDAERGSLRWSLDMPARLGVFPTHMSASSPLVMADSLFTLTSNGPDERGAIPAPQAPSFLAVDRRSGEVHWTDASPGDGLVDGQWGSAASGVIGGTRQVVFPGGDGWLYGFAPESGELLWKFNGNSRLESAEPRHRNAIVATPVIWEGRVYVGMGRDPEAGSGPGFLWALDPSAGGDITANGVVWVFENRDFGRTISTVAIADGLLYAADVNGFLHCLEAESGIPLWSHDMLAAVWGSPLVADGKVYLGDDDGEIAVLRAGRGKELLAEIDMGAAVLSSPTAADGVLYVMTRERLFALAGGELE